MIADFERIFNTWTEEIEKVLKDVETVTNTEREPGPKAELDNWRTRMRKLTCISEQLRSKNCRTVYDVLTQAS
jgi:dynein heavy chain, axonemal